MLSLEAFTSCLEQLEGSRLAHEGLQVPKLRFTGTYRKSTGTVLSGGGRSRRLVGKRIHERSNTPHARSCLLESSLKLEKGCRVGAGSKLEAGQEAEMHY